MLFDEYIMVDWSAAGSPRAGPDSIWIAILNRHRAGRRLAPLRNPRTRWEATRWLGNHLAKSINSGRRSLVGFDFPFGFPAGTAAGVSLAGLPWRNFWQLLSDGLCDDDENRNNRFDLAENLNRKLSGDAFPFWGNVREETRRYLVRRGRRPHGEGEVAERRLIDLRVPGAQPVWKLAGIGSVGSQALTGIPKVWALRRDPRLAMKSHIWPFETGLRYDPGPQIIFAEIYPSLFPIRKIVGKPKDAAQVAATVRALAVADETGRLESLFAADPELTATEKAAVEREEAWILGVTGGSEK
ncbi:MAG TPA: cobalamin biosynthesis protein CbiG [Rhodospirillaceae bacterium]|nr:cobalamin biosynthesis protein CbiG [Rhodospirillaceae bacterium]HAA90867.1 cobalamin biosynthesis protein CbiG [Rhodospirillaceae bacterium]HAT36577.1 cobalamin biosynthesis protein CbiG [Rhodospirillaceae bacterium]